MRRQYINYPSDVPVLISYSNLINYPIHWHNSIEILYVLKGNFKVTIDSDSYELIENDIEIVNIDEAHSIHSKDKDNRILMFHIDPAFLKKYFNDIENMFFYTNIKDDNAQMGEEYDILRKYLSRIICEFVQRQEDYDKQIEDILVNILYHLINNFHFLTSEREELREKEEQLERYHRITKYIYNNYNDNITLQDIAKKEFLSTHYLSHEIKDTTGYSFTDLLNLTRVDEALKLLLDTDKTITEISQEVGFSHVRYLNKHFKIQFSCSPNQYRKKYKVDEEHFETLKKIKTFKLKESMEKINSYLEDYDRFNYEDLIDKIYINMSEDLGEFNKEFKEVIDIGDAFELLIEDNRDILQMIQNEIGFKYVRLLNVIGIDMGIFPGSEFCNWNRSSDVFEFLENMGIGAVIVLDDREFKKNEYIKALKSLINYFKEVDTVDINSFKFQFEASMKDSTKEEIIELLDGYNLTVMEDLFCYNDSINYIYDTAYMLPFIIHKNVNSNEKIIHFLRAFDVLDKQVKLTNEVFFGYPGLVNDKGIKKPSYYAYYLMNKLGDTLVCSGDGYIVTKSEGEYEILLYSYYEGIDTLDVFNDFAKFKGRKNITEKKISLNIVNISSSVKITMYEINESVGSSYNYWLDMGKPRRLNKEEKEILHKAAFPRIYFKNMRKSTIVNIRTALRGYGAVLILIKEV
ncbi:helix-turn-helix domain-containing protein [Clostridium felsineum]|uniref:HTH-type transcriptional activator RhaS n=1 Tax=Clostridium felsineum TaxID=36839 RepID=A0A1S8LU19_9CLOT|nr:helix-turn-helix domain-containing protein [Clostridium felsineum]MCR3757656.1 helix-turn-helix domain-containing protein [Clostridium felsineum]URZ08408.1 HTH-type transcriptional activator RhaS [Clostridium felsineum]URZ13439.1 HTH-type transcriptional activator RhaS [Clostridium felsineum]